LNAVANLIKETCKLGRYSQRNFEPAIKEIASVEKTIQTLIDIAVDLQNLLSSLIILQIELVLPLEGEKSELPTKGEGVSQEIDYTIKIGPVNIYSMAGALGDTFAKFEAQTAGIAGIYAPYAFSEASQAVTPELIEMMAKGSEDAANIGRNALLGIDIEAPEKIVSSYDKALSLRTETLYEGLKKSALIINELKSLRDRMANISVEREILPAGADMPARIPDTLVLAEQKQRNGVIARSEIFREIEEFSGYINHFSVAMDKASTALQTKILEAHEVTDISALNKMSVKDSQPAGLTKGEQHPVTYPGQRMIEIPVFMPREKVSMPTEETAINAARLSDAIAKEYSEKDTISFSRESLSAPIPPYAAALPSLSAPSTYVSNAFETISDYITVASEIDHQMIELTEESRQAASKTIAPLNLLTKGDEASAALNLDRIAFGGYGGVASEGQARNIALSMAAAETLQRAGSSAIKEITAAVPPSGAGIRGLPTEAMPRAIENILQIFSAPTKETASAAQTGGRASFQNTFNIVVNVKGGGEESELRDLGRKIGLILSEEIKRYGGIR